MDDPTELAAEQAKIQRQQEIAKALLSNGGVLSGIRGQRMMEAADEQQAVFAPRYQAALAAEVARISAMRQGKDAIPAPADDLGGGPAAPAVAADPRAAINAAMLSQFAPVRRVADIEYQHQKKADEPYTLKPGEVRKTPGQPDVVNPNMLPEHESPLAKLLRERDALPAGSPLRTAYDDAIKKSSQDPKQDIAQPVTPVTIQDPNDKNGTIIIDGRTRQVLGKGPKLTETGKMEVGRSFKMQGLGGALQEAEDLLSGIKRDPEGNPIKGNTPTSSGAGSLYDSTAGFFGVSPAGAAEAAQLKVIAGTLTTKVPRMEGPQSDKDVALYKQMAGDAGNEKLPLETRLAAVREMKKLYAKYEHLNKDGATGKVTAPAKPAAPRVVDW